MKRSESTYMYFESQFLCIDPGEASFRVLLQDEPLANDPVTLSMSCVADEREEAAAGDSSDDESARDASDLAASGEIVSVTPPDGQYVFGEFAVVWRITNRGARDIDRNFLQGWSVSGPVLHMGTRYQDRLVDPSIRVPGLERSAERFRVPDPFPPGATRQFESTFQCTGTGPVVFEVEFHGGGLRGLHNGARLIYECVFPVQEEDVPGKDQEEHQAKEEVQQEEEAPAETSPAEDAEAPSGPKGVEVGLGGGSGELVVTWDANTEGDISYYILRRSTHRDAPFEVIARVADEQESWLSSETRGYIDIGDFDSRTCYRLTAVDNAGNSSEPSAVACFEQEPAEVSIHVTSIEGSYQHYEGSSDAIWYLTVVDADGNPIPDITAVLEVHSPDGEVIEETGVTNADGTAEMRHRTTLYGEYRGVVIDLVGEGYSYDPSANAKTELTVPLG